MARLLSINVGLPKDIAWEGRTVHTGILKRPVDGPQMVRRLNIDGDGQGDLAGHGGEHRAVLVYQQDSYRFWENQLGRSGFGCGQFGENFTVDGLADDQVYVGDRYRIGGALFEVTQPRVTCYRLGIRMDEPDMAALLVKHGRPGFYLRVIEEGAVAAGDAIVRETTGPNAVSIAAINALLYLPGHDPDLLERAIAVPALSEGWRSSLRGLLDQADKKGTTGNSGLTGPTGPPPAWRGFRPFRIAAKIRESDAVISLILEPTDGQPLPPTLPGQFIVLSMGATSPLMRSYSLSGEASAARYRVSIKREPHGLASAYANDTLEIGDLIQASAPRGSFTLAPGEGPVVLLSAGIGVTPVLAMLHALAAAASGREVWWLYGTRNGRAHPFAHEVHRLLASLAGGKSHICYSAPDPGDRREIDYDSVGHVDMALITALGVPLDGDFYLCGPTAFMAGLSDGLAQAGVARSRIHSEAFGAGPSMTPGVAAAPSRAPHAPPDDPASGPAISFARSGITAHWQPRFMSLLELAEACDVPVRWSCRTGVCHNCESGVISGGVRYQPDPLDAPAEGNLLLCCSRPEGNVVLDL